LDLSHPDYTGVRACCCYDAWIRGIRLSSCLRHRCWNARTMRYRYASTTTICMTVSSSLILYRFKCFSFSFRHHLSQHGIHSIPSFSHLITFHSVSLCHSHTTSWLPQQHASICLHSSLDELGESAIDRGAQRLDILPEVDGGVGALGDALGGELEFLEELISNCMDGLEKELIRLTA